MVSLFTKDAVAFAWRSIKSPVVGFTLFGNQLASHSTFISPNLSNRFSKNELVSFSKSYSPSSKSWNRAPVYPDSARRLGREGRVILEAQLNDLGEVISVQVARSSGSSDLDQAAIDAVREWTMDLPSDGSKRLFIPITFRFNSNS